MEDNTTYELNVIMHHIPGHFVAAGHPVVLPESIVAFNGHEFLGCAEVTVELGRLHLYDRILLETTRCRFHDGECLREYLIEYLLYGLVNFLYQLVRLCRQLLLLLYRNVCLQFCPDLCYAVLICRNGCTDLRLEGITCGTEVIIRKSVNSFICSQDLGEHRFQLL